MFFRVLNFSGCKEPAKISENKILAKITGYTVVFFYLSKLACLDCWPFRLRLSPWYFVVTILLLTHRFSNFAIVASFSCSFGEYVLRAMHYLFKFACLHSSRFKLFLSPSFSWGQRLFSAVIVDWLFVLGYYWLLYSIWLFPRFLLAPWIVRYYN